MKPILLAVLFLTFTACATSLPDLAVENQSNIARLSVGMSKSDVLKRMGDKTAETRNGMVANPFKTETFLDKQGRQYEVHYYVTERNRRGHAVTVANATPLVFRDGVLIGWGPQPLIQARTASR
jgi:hypothetical protein